MTVENHWKQLKHHYLQFTHRPRLDHALFIICTQAIPAFIAQAATLEDAYRMGRAKKLTTFQTAFKKAWRQKAAAKINTICASTSCKPFRRRLPHFSLRLFDVARYHYTGTGTCTQSAFRIVGEYGRDRRIRMA
ncbi:hypothetical protein BOTBODRAFT_36843 [Botryobasidium botryosum FD-172 SS1]|uniref:Uncharacterized protein n=1 Tax=Botryobasidium botryosum (strain FD-172 SS1) TaxID=930990 RepID=A0A067M2H5_BOTB1|nr:hypothetical protein BOTBODRAFT_36843 [Botryobasidium botryosum FD-172 SS1]